MIVAKTVNGFALLEPVYKVEKVNKVPSFKNFSTNTNQQSSKFRTLFTALVYPQKGTEAESNSQDEVIYTCYSKDALEVNASENGHLDFKC